MKKRLKRTVNAVSIIFILSALSGAAVLAAVNTKSSKQRNNYFDPAQISVAVVENDSGNSDPEYSSTLDWTQDGQDLTADKKVRILNSDNDQNNADAYIRVCMIPAWTSTAVINGTNTQVDVTNKEGFASFGDMRDITITSGSFSMGDVKFTLADGWDENWFFNKTDGFFYCKKPVRPGELTSELLYSVSISSDKKTGTYSDVSLRVDIAADAVSTEGPALSERWSSAGIEVNENKELAKKEGF